MHEITIADGTAVVTGAANGIGRELALGLARQGAELVLADIDEKGLAETARLAGEAGARVLARRLDVGSADDNERLAKAAFEWARRPLRLIFANAGVHGLTDATDPDLAVWDRAIRVNLQGPIFASKAFVKRLEAQGGPSQFVITASQGSVMAAPGMSPYIATKHAVWGFADCLRMELQQANSPVGVSLIAPSRTESGMTQGQLERARAAGGEEAAKAYAAQLVTADRVAEVILREVVKRPFWIVPSHEDVHHMAQKRFDAFVDAVPAGRISA